MLAEAGPWNPRNQRHKRINKASIPNTQPLSDPSNTPISCKSSSEKLACPDTGATSLCFTQPRALSRHGKEGAKVPDEAADLATLSAVISSLHPGHKAAAQLAKERR